MSKYQGPWDSEDNKTTRKMWIFGLGVSLVGAGVFALIDVAANKAKKNSTTAGQCDDVVTEDAVLVPSEEYGKHKDTGIDDNPEFLVENVKCGGINVVGGPTGACKSVLVMQMLSAISLGSRSIFDIFSETPSPFKGMKSFLYDRENGKERIDKRTRARGFSPSIEIIHKSACSKLNSIEKLLADIRLRVLSYGSDCCVCIDNLTRFCASVNDQTADQFYNGLEAIQQEMASKNAKVTFIVVCHATKGEALEKGIDGDSFRGTGNLVNFSDCSIGINKARGGNSFRYIKPIKERDSATDTVTKVQLKETPMLHLDSLGEMPEEDARIYESKSSNTSSNAICDPQPNQIPAKHGKRTPEINRRIEELMAHTPRPKDAEVLSELRRLSPGLSLRTWMSWKSEMGFTKKKQKDGEEAA